MPKATRHTPRRRVGVRIGPGEFRGPQDPSYTALSMFFEAIRTLVPEVFAELAPMINSAWIDDGKI